MRTELVTTLKRQATELLTDLERDREPILITQHGLPAAYLVDVATYETGQRRMRLLEGIARGEKDARVKDWFRTPRKNRFDYFWKCGNFVPGVRCLREAGFEPARYRGGSLCLKTAHLNRLES